MQSVATLPFNPLQVDAGHGFTLEDFLNELLADFSGHVHHAFADHKWNPHACETLEEFAKQLSFNHSEYMTFNTTYYKTRKIKFPSKRVKNATVFNVHEINAFVLDIDIYSEKARFRNDVERFLETLNMMVKLGIIPQYTFLINSGNGFYIIWKIERIRFSRRENMKKKVDETLGIYEAIQRYLVDLFKDFGADAQCIDPTRVYGIPGTYNCKNGERKRRYIMEYHEDAVTTMREFRQEYLPKDIDDAVFDRFHPEFDKKEKKKTQKNSTTKKTQNKKKQTRHKLASHKNKKFNSIDKHSLIIADLEKLVQLRKGQAMKGFRSLLSLMIRYSYGILKNDDIAVEKMLYLNSQFADPIESFMLVEQTKYAVQAVEDYKAGKVVQHNNRLVRAGYNYSKERMVDLLGISPEEQEQLEYIVDPLLTYERKKEKKRVANRDDYGLTKRDQAVLDTFIKVQHCKTEGMTQAQTKEKTGFSENTVERNWNKPNSKNSELIYSVYCEILSAQELEENPSGAKNNLSPSKGSCYVSYGVFSSGDKGYIKDTSLTVSDGPSVSFVLPPEVLTLEHIESIRDSHDSDDVNFKCLARSWKTYEYSDGTACDISFGETIRIYDIDGTVIWRNPAYFERKVPVMG